MQITIHQGAGTIGGNCVEVIAGNTRLLLDAGIPLEESQEEMVPVEVPRTLDLSRPFDALLLSHAHADHFGLIERMSPLPEVWMSKGTSQMLHALRAFARTGPNLTEVGVTVPAMKPRCCGAITVTFIPVDHSVHGAMAFLLEAGGKRLLYTGDLRTHGRSQGPLKAIFDAVGGGVLDAVITEGTTLDRPALPQQTELDLEERLTGDLKACPGLARGLRWRVSRRSTWTASGPGSVPAATPDEHWCWTPIRPMS